MKNNRKTNVVRQFELATARAKGLSVEEVGKERRRKETRQRKRGRTVRSNKSKLWSHSGIKALLGISSGITTDTTNTTQDKNLSEFSIAEDSPYPLNKHEEFLKHAKGLDTLSRRRKHSSIVFGKSFVNGIEKRVTGVHSENNVFLQPPTSETKSENWEADVQNQVLLTRRNKASQRPSEVRRVVELREGKGDPFDLIIGLPSDNASKSRPESDNKQFKDRSLPDDVANNVELLDFRLNVDAVAQKNELKDLWQLYQTQRQTIIKRTDITKKLRSVSGHSKSRRATSRRTPNERGTRMERIRGNQNIASDEAEKMDNTNEQGTMLDDAEIKDLHTFVACIEEYIKLLPQKANPFLKSSVGTQPLLRDVESLVREMIEDVINPLHRDDERIGLVADRVTKRHEASIKRFQQRRYYAYIRNGIGRPNKFFTLGEKVDEDVDWVKDSDCLPKSEHDVGIFTQEDRDTLDIRFSAAKSFFKGKQAENLHLSGKQLRLLGAIEQQATKGPCTEKRPQNNIVKAALYDAWKELGQMPNFVAKQKYISILDLLNPQWAAQDRRASEYLRTRLDRMLQAFSSGTHEFSAKDGGASGTNNGLVDGTAGKETARSVGASMDDRQQLGESQLPQPPHQLQEVDSHVREEYFHNQNPADHRKPLVEFFNVKASSNLEDGRCTYGEAKHDTADRLAKLLIRERKREEQVEKKRLQYLIDLRMAIEGKRRYLNFTPSQQRFLRELLKQLNDSPHSIEEMKAIARQKLLSHEELFSGLGNTGVTGSFSTHGNDTYSFRVMQNFLKSIGMQVKRNPVSKTPHSNVNTQRELLGNTLRGGRAVTGPILTSNLQLRRNVTSSGKGSLALEKQQQQQNGAQHPMRPKSASAKFCSVVTPRQRRFLASPRSLPPTSPVPLASFRSKASALHYDNLGTMINSEGAQPNHNFSSSIRTSLGTPLSIGIHLGAPEIPTRFQANVSSANFRNTKFPNDNKYSRDVMTRSVTESGEGVKDLTPEERARIETDKEIKRMERLLFPVMTRSYGSVYDKEPEHEDVNNAKSHRVRVGRLTVLQNEVKQREEEEKVKKGPPKKLMWTIQQTTGKGNLLTGERGRL
eukprot:g2967.t1